MGVTVGLDLATKAGIGVLRADGSVVSRIIVERPKKISEYGHYPYCYVQAAQEHAAAILHDVAAFSDIERIVIEETNLSKGSRYAQKYLEFLHFAVLEEFQSIPLPIIYLDTGAWRKALGIALSKEQRKGNARLKVALDAWLEGHPGIEKVPPKERNRIKSELGIAGKVTSKHLSVAYANQRWGLDLKKGEDDVADALCVAAASQVPGVLFCDGR